MIADSVKALALLFSSNEAETTPQGIGESINKRLHTKSCVV
jgi:hypothetical protein